MVKTRTANVVCGAKEGDSEAEKKNGGGYGRASQCGVVHAERAEGMGTS